MKYITYAIELESGEIDTTDPFSLVPSSTLGEIVTPRTRHHANRLEALLRVRACNSGDHDPQGPLLWTMAVEVDLNTTPDLEAVWLHGEQGVLEATLLTSFRFLTPTLEEGDLLTGLVGSGDDWREVEKAVVRLEWELPDTLGHARERLAEALACYQACFWRPSIVMLGCVAEAVISELTTAFERVLLPEDRPNYQRRKKACGSTSERFRVFERFCRPDAYALAGCQTLQEARETYHAIRRLRNQSGHPSGARIDQEDAAGCFGTLAEFCHKANRLTDHFDRLELERVR